MTQKQKDLIFYSVVAVFLFVILYIGIGHFVNGAPPPAE